MFIYDFFLPSFHCGDSWLHALFIANFFSAGRALLLAVQPRRANKLFESWLLYRNLQSFMSSSRSVELRSPWSFPRGSLHGPLETVLAYRVTGPWNSSPTRTSSWYLCCYKNSSASTKLVKQESLRKPEQVGCVEVMTLARVAYDKLKKVKVGKNDTTTF